VTLLIFVSVLCTKGEKTAIVRLFSQENLSPRSGDAGRAKQIKGLQIKASAAFFIWDGLYKDSTRIRIDGRYFLGHFRRHFYHSLTQTTTHPNYSTPPAGKQPPRKPGSDKSCVFPEKGYSCMLNPSKI
jgi:hypothetical protein